MRTGKNLLYLALLLVALFVGLERWRVLLQVLCSGACYFATLPLWPVWLPLGAGCASYLGYFFWLLVSRRSTRLLHHAAVLFLFAAVILMRTWEALSVVPQTQWRSEDEAPPPVLLARAAGRLKRALDERKAEGESYPVEREALEELLRDKGRMPSSGFLGHGLRLPVQVVLVSSAEGPVLTPRPDDRPGTLYVAVSEDGGRYWITLLGMSDYPCGRAEMIAGEDRAPLVLEAGDGAGGEE